MPSPPITFNLPSDFYSRYWQREPLLIRDAVESFASPLSADDLAGLACLSEVESRLVIERGCAVAWEVRHGPFEDDAFTNLPQSHWTLLVQAVDHWDDEVTALRRLFPEIPNWRIDDVMVSYAVDGGSVGPHSDSYDVFLLQGVGQRRWHLGGSVDSNAPLQSHEELRLLKDFESKHEFLLGPGDALYVPPNHAHWGIAEGECMTFSIGYRAPTHAEIISGFAATVMDQSSDEIRYRDPSVLEMSNHPGEITLDVVHRMREIVERKLTDKAIETWLGVYATEQKYETTEDLFDARSAFELLQNGATCSARRDSRFAFSARASGLILYANGQCIACPNDAREFVERLCDGELLESQDIARWRETVVELLRLGAIDVQ
jgi:50S ribosomal protein L16 3-hydroxylase